jgi:hypothetical protein
VSFSIGGSPAAQTSRVGSRTAVPAALHAPEAARASNEQQWRVASWILAAVLLVAAFRMALDSGITLDEEVHKRYGDEILAWFTSGFSDDRATTCAQRLYGGLFDLIGAALIRLRVLPLEAYMQLHVLSALFGLVAVWGASKLAALVGGARAGFLAALFLALTPSFSGHALFNPKDIPFAAGATLALYAAACFLVEPAPLSWKSALRAGLCTGIALAMRPGGMFLLGYPLTAALLRLGYDALAQRSPRHLARSLFAIATRRGAALALAWVVMIAAWPWAQQQPLLRPFEAARETANYQWRHQVLFNGERVFSYELPWTYLPTWFGITLPELYLLALLCTVICGCVLVRKRVVDVPKLLVVLLCSLGIALPLLGVLVAKPIIYDAHRHFLFLFPPLAALAGIATARVLAQTQLPVLLRRSVLAGFCVLAGLCIVDMHALHPYQYIYFNRLFGGLPAAHGRFETDYWGAANREAFLWVLENVESKHPTRVGVCYATWQIDPIKGQVDNANGFKPVKANKPPGIYIATTRDGCHESQAGRVIHTVDRHGVALAYVFER